MRWAEFRQWAIDELGYEMDRTGYGGDGRGGSQSMARVLGLDKPGTGNRREYGFREQQRLRTWVLVERTLGREKGQPIPDWLWGALRISEVAPEGVIVVETYEGGNSIHFHKQDDRGYIPLAEELAAMVRDHPPHTLLAIPVKGRA